MNSLLIFTLNIQEVGIIMKNCKRYLKVKKNNIYILLVFVFTVFFSYIIYANAYVQELMKVNEKELPQLDNMYIIKLNNLEKAVNKGEIYNERKIYPDKIMNLLLYSELANKNPYIIEKVKTDNENFAILMFENYVTGDTSNYRYNEEEGFYEYQKGKEYYSPVSLKADIILSENQMNNGWSVDYLGNYQFKEQYISKQGYKVNIIESKTTDSNEENYISEKCAVFVADGIRYTLKGRTSLENIKAIIDTMKYKK